jgi:hypothetical protein
MVRRSDGPRLRRRTSPATLPRVSAPHAPPRPAAVALDERALRDLAGRLADLDAGAPKGAALDGMPHQEHQPERLHRLEALSDRGAIKRARAAHALVSALPSELRPAARWLATGAPFSSAVDAWPALLARALGPRELAVDADAAAARVAEAKGAFNNARALCRTALTAETARRLDAARAARAAAILASNRAAADLDAWERVQLAAVEGAGACGVTSRT